MVARRDRQVGHGLGHFVAHAELAEGFERTARQMGAFFTQVELEIHFGLVEIAEPLMVQVSQRVTVLPSDAI